MCLNLEGISISDGEITRFTTKYTAHKLAEMAPEKALIILSDDKISREGYQLLQATCRRSGLRIALVGDDDGGKRKNELLDLFPTKASKLKKLKKVPPKEETSPPLPPSSPEKTINQPTNFGKKIIDYSNRYPHK